MRFNIFSGSRDGNGLAAAFTNPTVLSRRKGTVARDYQVYFEYRSWLDAEEAFLTLSRRNPASLCDHDKLMCDIIAAKLQQHPHLFIAVRQRGGVAFLRQCEHYTGAQTARFRKWEGYGVESRFIRNLIAGYEVIEKEQHGVGKVR